MVASALSAYAAVHMGEAIKIERPSGSGASAGFTTIHAAAACWSESVTGAFNVVQGGPEALNRRRFVCAAGTGARIGDVLTRADATQWRAQDVDARAGLPVLVTATMER